MYAIRSYYELIEEPSLGDRIPMIDGGYVSKNAASFHTEGWHKRWTLSKAAKTAKCFFSGLYHFYQTIQHHQADEPRHSYNFV